MDEPIAIPPALMLWLSPAFPAGGYAYSHGLEWAISDGWIRDRAGLSDWLETLIEHGSVRNDLLILAESWRASTARDYARLAAANEEAVALTPSAERHLEAITQGAGFVAAIRAGWSNPATESGFAALDGDVAYAVAVGIAAAGHGFPLPATLLAYGIGFAGNLASAAIRLSLIGQFEAQALLSSMMHRLEEAARHAATTPFAEIGGSALRADLAAMFHETQYSRLFRS